MQHVRIGSAAQPIQEGPMPRLSFNLLIMLLLNGVYLIQLQANERSATRRVVLIK